MKATEREQKIDELWADVAMPVQNVILNANLVAREIARHRDRASWLEVGKGWVEIRDEALRRAKTPSIRHPKYSYYHGLLMAKAPDLAALEEHDHAGCRHAVWLFENWTVIERWLADQEVGKNLRDLNHPSVIKRRFDAAHRRKPQGLKKPPTAAARKEARIHELEAENRLRAALRRGSETRRDHEPLTRRGGVLRPNSLSPRLATGRTRTGCSIDDPREWAASSTTAGRSNGAGRQNRDRRGGSVWRGAGRTVRYADTEARKPRLRRRKTAPEPPPARPLLQRPV
jgi:hypothetical protein